MEHGTFNAYLFRHILNSVSTIKNCPHSGFTWKYYDGTEFTENLDIKVECQQSK